MSVGILALQGCIDPHHKKFAKLGVNSKDIRSADQLNSIDRLVLPGGESTTMLKLLYDTGLDQGIKDFGQTKPVWGVCAGSILLAEEVHNPSQASLGLMAIAAHRNHYGPQTFSFSTSVNVTGIETAIEAAFIRAPLLIAQSPEVEVLARHEGQEILLKQDRLLASAFHAELGHDSTLHKLFLEL